MKSLNRIFEEVLRESKYSPEKYRARMDEVQTPVDLEYIAKHPWHDNLTRRELLQLARQHHKADCGNVWEWTGRVLKAYGWL